MADRLQVLFEVPSEDINFVVEFDSVTDSLSAESNKNPSPAGRKVTSSRIINDDVFRVRGWIRTLKCYGQQIDETDLLPKLKRVLISQNYTTAEYATITTVQAERRQMELVSVDFDMTYKKPQEIIVSMTWKSANFTGEVGAADFIYGGVQ